MFNKEKFSNILKKINDNYSSMTEFAKNASLDRSYISKYISQKLDNPPTPKILFGIARAAKGITTYNELMEVCGYLNSSNIEQIIASECFDENLFLLEKYHLSLNDINNLKRILIDRNANNSSISEQINNYVQYVDISTFDPDLNIKDLFNDIININDNISTKLVNLQISILDKKDNYFEFAAEDDAMYPLLDVGDVALVYKQDNIEDGATLLINMNNHNTIRKFILSDDKTYYKLVAMNGYYKNINIKLTDIDTIKILGKVVKAENTSAFK